MTCGDGVARAILEPASGVLMARGGAAVVGLGARLSKASVRGSCIQAFDLGFLRSRPESRSGHLRSGLLQFTLQPFRSEGRRDSLDFQGQSAERRKVAVERLVETRDKCGSERAVCVV